MLAVNWDYYDNESGIDLFEVAIYEMRYGSKIKILPDGDDPSSVIVIDDPTSLGHTLEGLRLQQEATYITLVRAINHAKLVASHETTGIKIDISPPNIIYVRSGTLDGEEEEIHNGYVYQSDKAGIQASWLAQDGESGVFAYWVTVITDLGEKDFADYKPLGSQHDGYISSQDLELTDETTCTDDEFTPRCQPVYYVCVKAENGAGAFSMVECSSPIRVVEEDKVGYGADGAGTAEMHADGDLIVDDDAQLLHSTVSFQFTGFESQLNGISHYEWAVGTEPGMENVQAFTQDGIVFGEKLMTSGPGLVGLGKAQSPLPLQHAQTYHSTIRAITGAGDILEAITDGFTVDRTPPINHIFDIAGEDFSGIPEVFDSDKQVYHDDANTLTALWNTSEVESIITNMFYMVGSFPGGADIQQATWTHKSYISPSEVMATEGGVPNYLTISSINSVGLTGKTHAVPLIIDTTPPISGMVRSQLVLDTTPPISGMMNCPRYLSSNDLLRCSISGFHDAESGISHCRFFVGTVEGYQDVYESPAINGCVTSYDVPDLHLEHNEYYYATVEVYNNVNQLVRAYSDAIIIDDTHPIGGAVVELSSEYYVNGTSGFSPWESVNCTNVADCMTYDTACLQSVSEVAIAWQPFTDLETEITRYEIGLGTAPGGSQLREFFEVPTESTKVILDNLDLSDVRKVVATVRGYNSAGLSSIATSNGAYISRLGAGLPPMTPIEVRDGYFDTMDLNKDIDFQSSLDQLSVSWDFSGEPCPIADYKWTAYRIDGNEYQPWINVGTSKWGSSDASLMKDGETYVSVVKATNLIGLTMTHMSDGITVQRDPLIPGNVYDGTLLGRDLTYQVEVDSISANWDGFGGNSIVEIVEHTGNNEVEPPLNTQTVDYYEVAVGTDRRYPKTRDNVVAFTNVGTNTSVTFEHLDLQPVTSVYYVTVRAHSASFAKAEVTSTGITPGVESMVNAGETKVDRFVNSLTTVNIAWSGFESNLALFFFYVGVTTSSEAVTTLDCEEVLLANDVRKEVYKDYNVSTFTNVGLDTYRIISDLTLDQAVTYYATVIGVDVSGKCNSSTAEFTIDVTPPVEGRLRIGPYYDMPVTYTDSTEFITVVWEEYSDPESDIDMYAIRLLSARSCHELHENSISTVVNWIEIGANYSSYKFVDLSLQVDKPYFVELEVGNGAESKIKTSSTPVLLDTSEPSPGFVVDGLDYKMDAIYHGKQNEISGSFLHYANPFGQSCPQRLLDFSNVTYWDHLNSQGLWNMDGAQWDLKYQEEQVSVEDDDTLSIKLERDTQHPQMMTGGYVTDAAIGRGGTYMVDIKAAPSFINAVTSIVFWDGPPDVVGEYNKEEPDNWQDDICSCCFITPLEESACWCNCTEYFLLNEDKVNATSSTDPNDPGDSEPYVRNIVEMGTNDYLIPRTACGFQLHPDGEESEATLWCRYYRDEYVKIQRTFPIEFDPSLEWHTYTLDIKVYPTEAEQDQWELSLLVDGFLLTSLDGIPGLSTSTRFILHVWNRDNNVIDLTNPLDPPNAVAYFRNLRIPPASDQPCRQGKPFRPNGSPIIAYQAGVGTAPGEMDIVSFQEFFRPCIPCLQDRSICQRYQCSDECQDTNVTPYSFTVQDITLPEGEVNETTGAVASALYYVTVNAVAGNGKTCYASSNGVNMDLTPPELGLYFYLDVTQSGLSSQAPEEYQASNTTIQVFWRFIDKESEIKEFYWAIGSSRGSTDLQPFEYVGLNQTSTNSSLEGLLHDNQTYYVTVKARNGAGLESVHEFDGVTVLLTPPPPEGVIASMMFTEPFDKKVFPPDAMKTTNPHATGACWTKADDETATRYGFCVGSSPDIEDDIVECMIVGNSSGCVRIIDGKIEVKSDEYGRKAYNISDFLLPDGNGTFHMGSRFNMEPGKCLHTTLKICNEASLCAVLSTGTTTVIVDGDEVVTSSGGENIHIDTSETRRRKRQVAGDFELTIETTGGLQSGSSLLYGVIDEERAQQDYSSDASLSFCPYITDHQTDEIATDRILRGRIKSIHEKSFFISSLGQMELQGPMILNITFSTTGSSWNDGSPVLLYWDCEQSRWLDAGQTCIDTGTRVDQSQGRMSVLVCATRRSASDASSVRSRRESNNNIYFSKETQFAVASISPSIVNNDPYFVNLDASLTIDEEEEKLEYQMEAADKDGDKLQFVLDTSRAYPALGTVIVTPEGLLTYKPCKDCHGQDVINVAVEEVHSLAEIIPASTRASIDIIVRSVNDNPFVFAAQRGQISSSKTRSALFAVEQNSGQNLAYMPLMVTMGTYDVDMNDELNMQLNEPTHGKMTVSTQYRDIPINAENCNSGSETIKSTEERVVPCGLVLPRDKDYLSWSMMNITYTPDPNYVGRDTLSLLSRDQEGAMSQLLIVNIDVYEPCLTDECLSMFSLVKESHQMLEHEEIVTVSIVREGYVGHEAFVTLELIGKEATIGTDVVGSSFLVRFHGGQTQTFLQLGIIDDNIREPDEEFIVRLTSPVGGIIQEPFESKITILDDESSFSFKYDAYEVHEDGASVTITVVRGGYLLRDASVRVTVISSNATANKDFSPLDLNLHFQARQQELSRDIAIFDDDVFERKEIFIARLTSPVNGVVEEPTDAVISIIDDEELRGYIQFTEKSYTVVEDNGVIEIQLTRTALFFNMRVTIRMRTTDITGKAGEDYEASDIEVEFPPQETTASATIPIIDDYVKETVKTFRVTLSDPSEGSIGSRSQAVVSILDNDGSVATFLFDSYYYNIFENAGLVLIRVLRNGDQSNTGSVRVAAASAGTSTVDTDYEALNEVVSFGERQTVNFVQLKIIDDDTIEDDEYVLINLMDAENGALGVPSQTRVDIKNDDALFNLETTQNKTKYVNEVDDSVTLTVDRSGYLDTYAVVVFSVIPGSAHFNVDYIGDSVTFHFVNGQTSAYTNIQILNDDEAEGNEDFLVTLRVNEGGRVGSRNEITVTILDDDEEEDSFSPGDDKEPNDTSQQGPIVAGAIGGLVVILLVIFIALVVYYRLRFRDKTPVNYGEDNENELAYALENQLALNNFILMRTFEEDENMQFGLAMDVF